MNKDSRDAEEQKGREEFKRRIPNCAHKWVRVQIYVNLIGHTLPFEWVACARCAVVDFQCFAAANLNEIHHYNYTYNQFNLN